MNNNDQKKSLTHLNAAGQAHMVDISNKPISQRMARAGGRIQLSQQAFTVLTDKSAPKGDVLAVARIAAITAAKRTAEWIPLCHCLPLESIRVDFQTDDTTCRLDCQVTVTTGAKTGVEMEALVGVQAGLLTIYDMLKAIDRTMVISDIRLLEKTGGISGHFQSS